MAGQTGGFERDQAKATGNPSHNPFAKIFRDQSAAGSLLNRSSHPTSDNDEGRVSNLESRLGTQAGSGASLSFRYLGRILGDDELRVTEEPDVVETSSILLTAGGLNESGEVVPIESSTAFIGLLSGNLSQDKPVFGVVVSPHAFLQGKPGGEIGPTVPISTPAGLPFFTGTSSSQTQSVGSPLAEHSTTDLATGIKVDSQLVLRNAVSGVGEAATEPDTNQVKIADRPSIPVQDGELRLPRNASSPIESPQGPLKSLGHAVNQAFQAPVPFEETPAGIADAVQSSQTRLKYVSGVSSVLSESFANGKESSIGIPLDFPGEANVPLTGDRSRDVLEATGKALGVDPNAGQGLNNGMGSSTHSQSGFFHQSSSSPSPGLGVRMAEERGQDFHGPALQRLQMEVQLSETNRVQIDVGVQHRQVYAGLLMDQAILRNLAVQFVPQLEEQLIQGEMELQEFSAEVRDHRGEQESDTGSDGPRMQMRQRGSTSLHHAPGSLSHVVKRAEEQGMHLVA